MERQKMFSDLTKLPPEHLPKIDDLPGELARLAEIIEKAAPGKGVTAVLHLEKNYGSMSVYFCSLDELRRDLRNNWIVEQYSGGRKVVDIARDVSLSPRRIWDILGTEPDNDKQLKLF